MSVHFLQILEFKMLRLKKKIYFYNQKVENKAL